jgi:hypothetical protein
MAEAFTPKFHVMPYKDENGKAGFSKILNYAGRHTVLANVRGTKVPFYISTGLGGKEGVEPGKWYPHFGIAKDGWINKWDDRSMNTCYDSKHLKDVADWLNTNVGDTRGPGGTSIFGHDDSSIPRVNKEGPHIEEINSDVSPVEWGSNGVDALKNNIANTLIKIHQHPRAMSQGERITDSARHTLLRNHAAENPDLDLGTHLP